MADLIGNSHHWVEFSGLVGAGKTTIAAVARNILTKHGYLALTELEATYLCLERSLLGKTLLFITLPGYHKKTLDWLYYFFIRNLFQVLFVIRYPALSLHVYRSAKFRKSLNFKHKTIVLRRFFHLAASYHLIRSRLKENEVVVLDEGLVHRAINLYAWTTKELDKEDIKLYFELLPDLDHLIILKAPTDVCTKRASVRGFPKQLKGKPEDIVHQFMENSFEIINIIESMETTQITKMTILDNSTLQDSITSTLQNSLLENRFDRDLQVSNKATLITEN